MTMKIVAPEKVVKWVFYWKELIAQQKLKNNDGSYTSSFVLQQVGEMKLTILVNGQHIKESPYSVAVKARS